MDCDNNPEFIRCEEFLDNISRYLDGHWFDHGALEYISHEAKKYVLRVDGRPLSYFDVQKYIIACGYEFEDDFKMPYYSDLYDNDCDPDWVCRFVKINNKGE